MTLHTAKFKHCTPNAEREIVEIARVSNPKNQQNHSTAPKLVRFMLEHGHVSPFEMASLCVEINTTRAIAPQILRHGKGFSFQEFSQRYADPSLLPPIELPMLRRQDKKNRQASHDDLDPELVERLKRQIEKHYNSSRDLYQMLVQFDVAKECARDVLPLGVPSRLYMHGNLRSWIHYIQLRCGIETQLEHRLIANDCREIFKEYFPIVYEAAHLFEYELD